MIRVEVVDAPIDAAAVLAAVASPAAGATALFLGTVRATPSAPGAEGREVVAIEYEAHRPLAEAEMRRRAEEAVRRFGLEGAAIVMRVGRLALGEASTAVAAAAAHRAEAFEACRFLLERLKESAPVWKKEVYRVDADPTG